MKTLVEVQIGDGLTRPTVRKAGDGRWYVTGGAEQCVAYGRGVWVRTYRDGEVIPVDGKGFLVGPTRKLKVG